jgi:hypothetical protein
LTLEAPVTGGEAQHERSSCFRGGRPLLRRQDRPHMKVACQCCAQGKDARRDEERRRCCAKGRCCKQYASERTVRDAWTVLRSALSNAVTEELIPKNVAGLLQDRKWPFTCVGVAGFEPTTSSSRKMR